MALQLRDKVMLLFVRILGWFIHNISYIRQVELLRLPIKLISTGFFADRLNVDILRKS